MRVKTISATSLEVFENCAARFNAEKVIYADDLSGVHANLGSACHEVLERWVRDGWYQQKPMPPFSTMEAFFVEAYYKLFTEHTDFFDAGVKMLKDWYNRQDWNGVTVLTTEQKEHFALKIPGDEDQSVTYIFDRLDQLDDGRIRVVDYKSVGQPIGADDMKRRIQPRLYACAAQTLFPDAPGIWVVYDLLRFDEVGVYYTKEENRDTYRYLQGITQRIRATEPLPLTDEEQARADAGEDVPARYPESINANCRWCVRKMACKTLEKNIQVGGQFSIDNFDDAVEQRARLKFALDAAKVVTEQLDTFIMETLVRDECTEAETPSTKVAISSRNMTVVDSHIAAKIAGPELVARYAKLTKGQVDAILKDPELTDSQKSQIKQQAMKKQRGSAYLKFTTKVEEGEDD